MKGRLLIATFVALSSTAFGQGLKDMVNADNKKVAGMLMKKDIAGFEKWCRANTTKDFKYVENGKPQTIDQMIQNMKMGMGMMTKMIKVEAKLVTLKQNGNTATATNKHYMKGLIVGQDKKQSTMEFFGTSNDTYKKVNGKWLLAKMEWSQNKMMMDGKPMNMGAGAGGG